MSKPVSRWLQIPKPVEVTRIVRGQGPFPPQPFSTFFVDVLLPKIPRKTKEDLERIRELAILAEDAEPGTWRNFTEGAYQALRASVPEDMNGLAVLTYLSFIDAIVNATTTRPKEVEPEPPANGATKPEPAVDDELHAAAV